MSAAAQINATRIESRLAQIETELRQLKLWQAAPPSAEALQSSEPFGVDTLKLSEWLQWILIPNIRALLVSQRPLPGNCNIYPIAEQCFAGLAQDCSPLLHAIEAFDKALSRSATP